MIFGTQNTGLDQLLFPLLGDVYNWGKTYIQRMTRPGMYEVLNYETNLEILDDKGENAVLRKSEQVRFLQNNIIAYQDQAWGDGKILIDYQCSPGYPVDFYRSGYKTFILISLRGVKNKGDISNFKIKWGIKNGFLKGQGFWTTDINHQTSKIKVEVVFPENRPPRIVSMIESNTKRIDGINRDVITQLPDKRWLVSWEKENPRLNEQYILKWEW